ncbi:MAG TPA: CCA tRNA nucleotidyltransferase, partial [Chloroflexota bacterium]|nr:CCA tRNA nucleotidyltransferase [Chloroflexota bacterium]
MTERAPRIAGDGNLATSTQAFDLELIGRLSRLFRERGQELYLVGGSVRDWILGRPTHDLDFATSALPEETEAILRAARPSHVYVIGQRFGTVGAIFGDVAVEITTYRGERYEAGSRKPEVHYGVPLYEDLARRDFTINAMAYDALGGE